MRPHDVESELQLLSAWRCCKLGLSVVELITNSSKHAFGGDGGVRPDEAADDLLVRERATTAREFDPAEVHRGRRADALPPIAAAVLPLIVVISVNVAMSVLVLPRIDVSFLAEPRWGGTSLSAVGGVWAVIVALASAILTLLIVSGRRLSALRESMDAGANACVLPVSSRYSVTGRSSGCATCTFAGGGAT